MAKTVLELTQLVRIKSDELHAFFEQHKTDKIDENENPIFDMDAQDLLEQEKRNTELQELNKELARARSQETYLQNRGLMDDLKGVERTVPRPASGGGASSSQYVQSRGRELEKKSLGQMVTESNEYKYKQGNKHFSYECEDVDLKTLISIGAGFTPPNYRTSTVIDYPNRRPVVADLIPTDPTNLQVVKWMEETTFTNAAASVSEGGAKPESAMAWTERSATVEKIATWVPVTEEQIDDVPTMAGLINRGILLRLQLVEETLLLTGTGVSPQMLGFLVAPNVQSQAKGQDDGQDAVYKAFTKVRWTGFAEPSGVIMHPTDWQNIRLLRTTDGLYIFGPPSEPGSETLWGKPVIVTSAITVGTALTGDFIMYSHISRKMGVRIDVANQHSTYFTSNLLVVRGEMRESLEISRQQAFCTVSGL